MTRYSNDELQVLKHLQLAVNNAILCVQSGQVRPTTPPYQPSPFDMIIGDFGITIIGGPFIKVMA